MSDPQEIWLELYAMLFARNRHPELWQAMANSSRDMKREIDDAAEAILERWCAELRGGQ